MHERETDIAAVKLLSDTDQKIVRKFSAGFSGIRACDRYVYDDLTVQDVLEKRQEDKIIWLRHVEAVRKRATRAESTQMEQMRSLMERWKKRRKK